MKIFHIFRNTPLGRETLMQSTYFSKQLAASLVIYIPKFIKFLMYFENNVVQVDLDESFLKSPKTARDNAAEIVRAQGVEPTFLEPKHFTASTLPDIPTNFDFMCCPRTISDLSSKVGLAYIGPRVRSIVTAAQFPVLITSPVYKPWRSIAVFFGGSANAIKALKLGLRIQKITGMQLTVYTQLEKNRDEYENLIREEQLQNELKEQVIKWVFFEGGNFEENLYEVAHDALVILGAYGHSLIRDLVFGSKMEKIQSTISNNLLIVGPKYIVKS